MKIMGCSLKKIYVKQFFSVLLQTKTKLNRKKNYTIMKKTTKYIMFVAAMTMMGMTTACSSDSLDDETTSYSSNGDSSTSSSEEVTTTTLSTMKNFTIAIDKTTAEPAATVAAILFPVSR